MVLLALPLTLDSPSEFCYCGRKTVETHEFLFCSTRCARQDSLRSLGDRECHYRNIVRDAYVQAGATELPSRRMPTIVNPHPGPMAQRGLANAPQDLARIAPWTAMDIPSTLPDGPLTGNPTEGMLVAERHGRSRREAFTTVPSRAQRPGGHTLEQTFFNAASLPKSVPAHSFPRALPSIDNGSKKSAISALLNFGRSRKGKTMESPGMTLEDPADNGSAPVRMDPRRMGRTL